MLPIIAVGDKVVYNGETEGVVTDIQDSVGYDQFTVKLLNGYTRICARYRISKIDAYFHESGPVDDEWMAALDTVADAQSGTVTPRGSEPTAEDWLAIQEALQDSPPCESRQQPAIPVATATIGTEPTAEDWKAIEEALAPTPPECSPPSSDVRVGGVSVATPSNGKANNIKPGRYESSILPNLLMTFFIKKKIIEHYKLMTIIFIAVICKLI